MLYIQAEYPDFVGGAVGVFFRADGGILVADDLRTADFLFAVLNFLKEP